MIKIKLNGTQRIRLGSIVSSSMKQIRVHPQQQVNKSQVKWHFKNFLLYFDYFMKLDMTENCFSSHTFEILYTTYCYSGLLFCSRSSIYVIEFKLRHCLRFRSLVRKENIAESVPIQLNFINATKPPISS